MEGGRLSLDLRVKVSRMTRPIERQDVAVLGSEKPLTVQFPEITTSEWSKTLLVPDGGSVIVGGWAMEGSFHGGDGVLAVLVHAKSAELAPPDATIKPQPTPAPDAPGEKPPR